MRSAATHNAKDLAKEIALLKRQLEELAESVNGTGNAVVATGEAALEGTMQSARDLLAKYSASLKSMAEDTREKAAERLIAHTETRPFATLAAVVGIGFLAGWLFRRH
jgi:ElaB/YqjD/DUF883 family membrane-anchored ribosome-binding protein